MLVEMVANDSSLIFAPFFFFQILKMPALLQYSILDTGTIRTRVQ